jgi:plasmid maintenance system killer protein
LFAGEAPTRFRAIETVATRNLAMLDAARSPDFMRPPPGNRLDALKGERGGQWSMRSNDRIHEIVKERRGVSAGTAARLARYFGGDAASWMALRADHVLKTLATRDDIARRVSPREAVPA